MTVQRKLVAQQIEQDETGATVHLASAGGASQTERARWVIGADGANSTVRASLGIERRDLGFRARWFVVDVEPHDMAVLDLPVACQWCDPARPTTHVQSGSRHRRWEFMLLPGEDAAGFDEARAWELLAPWFGPQDGTLLRHATYEFRSMVAEEMRRGRVLIAGDAAHLTPPFLGQGLCAGLRDAANIAWKLDLVLRGLAGEATLDTVTPERQPQNEWIIDLAVQLGAALCELDPRKAAERDPVLRAAGPPPELELVALSEGLMYQRAGGQPDPLAGRLTVQGRLEHHAVEQRLDDFTGGGFVLLARGQDCLAPLGDGQRAFLDELGATVVTLDTVRDVDGRTTAFLDAHDVDALIVRPDFYAFGSASRATELPALVDALRDQLHATHPAVA